MFSRSVTPWRMKLHSTDAVVSVRAGMKSKVRMKCWLMSFYLSNVSSIDIWQIGK